jgi:hypothetical protein
MDEHVIAVAEGIYRWEGPKRRATLLSATLGRLVLTSERLLFLSSGKHDVTLSKVLAGASGNTLRGLRTDRTDTLDLGALANRGSLDLPLTNLRSAELKGMFKFLSIAYDDASGVGASAFAPKQGGMPAGRSWVELIERTRGRRRLTGRI